MNKNKLFFTLAGFVVVTAVAITAQAAPEPKPCPPSYKLVDVDDAEDRDEARLADKPPGGNNNDKVCEASGKSGTAYRDDEP
jgi:hypothetical protein